jgi:hypothetical protein
VNAIAEKVNVAYPGICKTNIYIITTTKASVGVICALLLMCILESLSSALRTTGTTTASVDAAAVAAAVCKLSVHASTQNCSRRIVCIMQCYSQ